MHRPFNPSSYIQFKERKCLYLNDDDPSAAYNSHDISFVAQPTSGPEINKKHNIITVPLMMTDEWNIINQNPELIPKLRLNKKKYIFNFVGQCNYMDRDVFRKLDIEKYDFEETSPIYSLSTKEKADKIISFLHRISKSKFVFSPRGIGSSSFRAYQAMMVGSIPIITDMNDYPFQDHVDWDQICIRGNLNELNILIEKALNISDDQYSFMREQAIYFWDNYCRHDMLYKKLKEIYSRD